MENPAMEFERLFEVLQGRIASGHIDHNYP
jgi:hypothetical protein